MGIRLIDRLEVFGGRDRRAAGLAAVGGGRGMMAGWSFGFDLLRPCSSSLFSPSMTALGILNHYAKGTNMVCQYLVPLRLTSSAMEHDFCMGSPFGGLGNWTNLIAL